MRKKREKIIKMANEDVYNFQRRRRGEISCKDEMIADGGTRELNVQCLQQQQRWNSKNLLCALNFHLLFSILLYGPWLLGFGVETLRGSTTTAVTWEGDLRKLETSWNSLSFGWSPSPKSLKIALFVKKWPAKNKAGGLERHALTLHRALANRGHTVHVFTAMPSEQNPLETDQLELGEKRSSMHFHLCKTDASGSLNRTEAWQLFEAVNQTLDHGFDIIHTESVCLLHYKGRNLKNVVASWHGIGYETIHTDIVRDLMRNPKEPRPSDFQKTLSGRLQRVIEEIKFFASYTHHVAISDSVGEVLRSVYMLPLENVHIILNGADENMFKPDKRRGNAFRLKYGVPLDAKLVMGMAGRLVKDKGHPLVFEALKKLFLDKNNGNVFVLIAGNGPWASRYRELTPNVKVLGSLDSSQIADFYNALDIFVNPTLRAQGLDLTLLEAMLCGKPLLATHFSSITRSVIVNEDFGYTFSPTFKSLEASLEKVIHDGKQVLERKGLACGRKASVLFTATKMTSAYERLFLCVSGSNNDTDFCKYPLPWD